MNEQTKKDLQTYVMNTDWNKPEDNFTESRFLTAYDVVRKNNPKTYISIQEETSGIHKDVLDDMNREQQYGLWTEKPTIKDVPTQNYLVGHTSKKGLNLEDKLLWGERPVGELAGNRNISAEISFPENGGKISIYEIDNSTFQACEDYQFMMENKLSSEKERQDNILYRKD